MCNSHAYLVQTEGSPFLYTEDTGQTSSLPPDIVWMNPQLLGSRTTACPLKSFSLQMCC